MTPSESVYDPQGWSAKLYHKSAAFVYSSAFTAPILDLLAAQPGEKIIDLGCGSGEVSLLIEKIVKQSPGGLVVGVDSSESMIAKSKECGLEHAFVADIQNLDMTMTPFNKFDAAFSNAALHWCKRDPAGVLESVKKVLKPGGRLVVEMGGIHNSIGTRALQCVRSHLHRSLKARGYDPVAVDPWFFPSVEDYTKLLIDASFEPRDVSLTPRVTPLADGVRGWLECFARTSILGTCSETDAAEIIDEVEDALRVDCQDTSGNWAIMYTRLRFSAILKAN
ncbi:S-adenosyl-L-methionine-dependent methyltransferase [Mycena pura]|uniref:S-adenosyl-L-methionine-dependent methyltransferase n=1 Tax=Mycena pura TaxID=153505 RepID=A0AAD6YAS3_9AGAR|nr:S-adenosyl-L-methionine-dependent methyltransferase [Mycena pura]